MQHEKQQTEFINSTEGRELTRYLDGIKFWYANYGAVKTQFDPSFVRVIDDKHRKGLDITKKQFLAVKGIYTKWVKV